MDCVNSAKLRILLHSLLPAGIPAGALPGALRYDPRVSEPAYLTVAEVARHLRMGARKVYDLAARGNLPHRRVGGRLLFDRAAVDLWLGHAAQAESVAPGLPPAVVAGSHDPLLDWAVRESRCGLALLTQGSSDGLARLAAGQVAAALLHLPAEDLSDFNRPQADARLRGRGVALLEWARRDQGLLVAPGNPLGLHGVADLARPGVRVATRQAGAGSAALLERLLVREGIDPRGVGGGPVASSETDLALAVRGDRADVGLGALAAARVLGLDFVPLLVERLDLAVSRAAWFEPPLQALFAFARGPLAAERARALGGYDLTSIGTVRWNDPG